jgi:RNA polymerase sigma factor (sigma-70 family)
MNHNEIETCVIRAKAGSSEDLLKVLEQYKPFIFKTAKQFNIRNHDMYDLLQIGYVTLINAVVKYRTGSHTFSSYAYNAIKNAYKYTARQNSKFSNDLSLNTPVNTEGNINTEFIECIESSENLEEDIIHFEKINEVRSAVSKLSEDDIELVIMVYYSGISLKTYALKKHMSYLQAVRKKNKILEKLSEQLSDK